MTQHSGEPLHPESESLPSNSCEPRPDSPEVPSEFLASSSIGGDVFLRGPAELADALPYVLGFYPDDSIVVVALHGERGRFGGRIRLGIPQTAQEWPTLAAQVARCLENSALTRNGTPDGALLFLCQEPEMGQTGAMVMERLRPLAQLLRTACGGREMPVYEALCLSGGRFWSYCCLDPQCCPAEGRYLTLPGTSAMAAAAAFAGAQPPGSLRAMEERLSAVGPPLEEDQKSALDSAAAALASRMFSPEGRQSVRRETRRITERLMERFRRATPPTDEPAAADGHDDRLLSHGEAAATILGLQDREARDQAAEWMEGDDAQPALRLWRALARRCVIPFAGHAAAPLTLAGWVAWSAGDEPGARVALGRALCADPDYLFARLLHQACNDGLDPEPIRRCMRQERAGRVDADDGPRSGYGSAW